MTQAESLTLEWHNTGETFSGWNAAETALRGAGFSIGNMQRVAPMGLLFGDFAIAKWRNLNQQERDELHGFVKGDCRDGTVRAVLYTNVPHDAVAAFEALRPPGRIEGGAMA